MRFRLIVTVENNEGEPEDRFVRPSGGDPYEYETRREAADAAILCPGSRIDPPYRYRCDRCHRLGDSPGECPSWPCEHPSIRGRMRPIGGES